MLPYADVKDIIKMRIESWWNADWRGKPEVLYQGQNTHTT